MGNKLILAQLILRKDLSLLSFGEGRTSAEARASAIYNLPLENRQWLDCECEWDMLEFNEPLSPGF